jgi:hypothetical protein
MPDRTVTSLRRTVAVAAVSALAAGLCACSSGKTDESWKAETAYGTQMAKKGFWREALFRYEKAAARKPGDAQIQNNLAVAYESTGDTTRALAAYKRALELAPQDAKIKRNYARFAEYYTSVQRSASLPAPSSSAPSSSAPAAAAPQPEAPGVALPKPSGAAPQGPGPETVPPATLPGSPAKPAGGPSPAPAPMAPSPAPTPAPGSAS